MKLLTKLKMLMMLISLIIRQSLWRSKIDFIWYQFPPLNLQLLQKSHKLRQPSP